MEPAPLPVHLAASPRSWFASLFQYTSAPKWTGTLLEFGSSVWIQHINDNDPFQLGLFGKGSLSRARPTWKSRTIDTAAKDTVFLEHITTERRRMKRTQDNTKSSSFSTDAWSPEEIKEMTRNQDYEQLLLDFYESFFLVYALNTLKIYDPSAKLLTIDDCWTRFSNRIPSFATRYAVYHYYRSLGWAPKQGSKFGVDFVLYRTGRKHNHGDFAVVVVSNNDDDERKKIGWKELHRLNRICTQVKKTLVLCYVIKPHRYDESRPQCLESFKVQELIIKRWSPERNREK
ncbi:tRNA intron endonuclease [Zychaea mexicana]|uniref:tRNA intron endonuclease n=1 Tax=Zychaea mexicana TaxID=64656 RepID=UPI0022FEDC26|nr:tRNA intron endonuclease [Zychaea mexicana]KAI9493119.1 tRNA intron endonuclease [Zychaea mexicana]